MGLTGVISALPQARVMAVTSSKRLCPADEDHVRHRDFFTPVGVQWGLKDSDCEWLNGNIAFDSVALGNLWLVGQPSPAPRDRAGSACQPSCLPHWALQGRDVLSRLDEEERQSLMHWGTFAASQRISPGVSRRYFANDFDIIYSIYSTTSTIPRSTRHSSVEVNRVLKLRSSCCLK